MKIGRLDALEGFATAPKNAYDEYAAWTDTTAKYPMTAPEGYCSEPHYLALGIADECGEFACADGSDNILKEAGDVLWYAARYSVRVLGIPFSVMMQHQENLPYAPSAELTMASIGNICGVEKKRIRDGNLWTAEVKEMKRCAARDSLVVVLAFIQTRMGRWTMEEAMAANQGKLNSRLAAGTIQGDGDNR